MTSSPKPFLFLNALHNVRSGQNVPTPKHLLTLQQHTGFDTRDCPSHTRDGCMWLKSTAVEDHAMTLASTPSNHQTPLFHPSFNPRSTPLSVMP